MINKEILNEVVRPLVDKFHPEKIILLGSPAHETADNRSDIDLDQKIPGTIGRYASRKEK